MCLDFCHAEACAVFIAEVAFVTGLDQRDTPRNMEWTQHATNFDPFVVYETGDTPLSPVDIILIIAKGQGIVVWCVTVDRFVFAAQVLTDEFREGGIIWEAIMHYLFAITSAFCRHRNWGEAPEIHLW